MASADDFLSQYQPQQENNADAFLSQYQPQQSLPWWQSAFKTGSDVLKSGSAAAARDIAQVPMWLGDTANATTQGITRSFGEGKEALADMGIGQHLTPEQAEKLTNPTLPFFGSQQVIDAAAPVIKQATGADVNYQPQTKAGEYAAGVVGAVPYAINPEMGLTRAVGMGVGQQAGSDIASQFTNDPRYKQAASILGGAAGVAGAEPAKAIANNISDAVINNDIGKNLPGILGDTSSGGVPKAENAPYSGLTSNQAFDIASRAYDAADTTGGNIQPNEVNKWLDSAAKILPQTNAGKLAFGNTAATNFLDSIQSLKDNPLSFREAEELDKGLGAEISKSYRAGDDTEASKFVGIQNGLRDAVQGLPDTSANVTEAKQAFSAASKMRDVENIIANAENADVPATAIKNGFKGLAKQIRQNPRGWTEDEIDDINNASKTGLVTGALKTIGGRLMSGIAGTAAGAVGGGIPGAIAGLAIGEGIGYPMRQAATALQRSKGQAVLNRIADRPVFNQQPEIQPVPQSPLALPAPKMVTDRYGNTTTEANAQSLPDEVGKPDFRTANNGQEALNARKVTSAAFDALDEQKKAQLDSLFQGNEKVAHKDIIENAANRLKDAGIPSGEIGNALMRLLANQEGSIDPERYLNLINSAGKYAPLDNKEETKPSQSSPVLQPANIGNKTEPVNTSMRDQLMQAFGNAESDNNPNAKNSQSSASGLMQFTDGTWKQMVKRYGAETGIALADKGDPKAQTVMAQLYARDNINHMQPFLQRNPTKGELYAAHVLGADGALRLINAANDNPNKQAIMLFPRATTSGNKNIFFNGNVPRTALEVYQQLNKKVN